MTTSPWYAFYPKDYRDKTNKLTMVQDGAYRRLMDEYYVTCEPLPLAQEEIFRAARAFTRDERAAVVVVLDRYFVKGDDGWHHLRIDEELIKRAELSAKRSQAGSNGGRNIKTKYKQLLETDEKQNQSTAEACSQSQSHPSEAKASSVNRTNKSEPPGFVEFYAAFPRKTARGAALKAYVSALKRAPAAVLLQGAIRYAQERAHEDQNFTKHPATWLTQDCWLDEPVSNRPNGGRHGGQQKSPQQSFGAELLQSISEDYGGPRGVAGGSQEIIDVTPSRSETRTRDEAA